MAIENQEIHAQKKEIESLLRKLGRANKKIERMQKKIDELRAVNQSFINRNDELYKKWRDADALHRTQDDKIWSELGTMSDIYEQRMAYLIDTYCPDQTLNEEDVKSWAQDREFALVADITGDDTFRTWKVVFKDGQQDTDVQSEEQE